MWVHPTGRELRDNKQDQIFFEWVLSHGARVLSHGDNPFFADQLNVPHGVNLMANTSILGAALPLAPVTLLFGPAVSVLVLLTLGPAGTATAWYLVLSREVARTRLAAVLGGAFCGFAPGMVSQATGHPNISGQFVLPFIVLAVLRLRSAVRPASTGALLGLLVVYQAFLNEELLFLTALALGVCGLGWRRRLAGAARPLRIGLAVAAAVAVPLLAYPLAVQFFGPQAYHGLSHWTDYFGADLLSYPAYPQQSVAGSVAGADAVSQGPTEQNSFFGWGLCLFAVLAVCWWRWEDPRIPRLALAAAVFAALSLGRVVLVRQQLFLHLPGPWWLVSRLPLFDSVVPTRLALVVTTLLGILLAVIVDARAGDARAGDARAGTDRMTLALVAVALVPLVPVPLRTVPAEPLPRFVASGDWRRYVPSGGTLLVAPFGGKAALSAMRWQIRADLGFRIAGGYFLGPVHGRTGDKGRIGPPASATSGLLDAHADWAHPPVVDPARRDAVRAELRDWRVDAVVLADRQPDRAAIAATVEQVLGPGEHVDDVTVWSVR